METVLLVTTIVALVVALVMSVAAARLARDERRRAAARVAALSVAAGVSPRVNAGTAPFASIDDEPKRAPWAPQINTPQINADTSPQINTPPMNADASSQINTPTAPELNLVEELPLQQGFLRASSAPRTNSGAQRTLALVAAVLFVALAIGLVWNIVEDRSATSAAAVAAAQTPLELVSLRHDRQSSRLAVSGLVRNPVAGRPVERLSAVVFLFDQQGSFITSAKAPVDFIKLGAGDESPFVVSLDAPANVARYRVSFRTDEGIMPHIDRRGAPPIADSSEQPVSVKLK
ncbi:MAG: hypothetical protein ABI665_08670 [Vicinamibacterales bacterium]